LRPDRRSGPGCFAFKKTGMTDSSLRAAASGVLAYAASEAISTERPRRFSTPDAIADPWSRSPRAMRCSALIK
jgi:hypothetical protein